MTTEQIPKPDTDDGVASHVEQPRHKQSAQRLWWIKPILQPMLLLAAGVLVIIALGAAQKIGWISAGGGGASSHASTADKNVRYICPMMCTPPQNEPGRCPVCAMELVPAATEGANSSELSIQVDPVARRVAHIRTVPAKAVSLTREIRAIGELSYDEGSLRTIAAYVDGRLDRLYADYTGVVVQKGDHLALVYSPQLYSSQIELLVAKRAREQSRFTALPSSSHSGRDLYGSARERLIEFGMTPDQIQQLQQAGKANSRLHLCAPISGTVIEKLAVQGQYVKTGQAIYRLADLSTVWLMLQLFPEDAASIRYGQKIESEVQSLPGRKFTGRVAFIDPTVDSKTRTVGVRVVIPNDNGLLRIGDYAKATISVQLNSSGDPRAEVYDPELAGKWISPRHPHVVTSSPGKCRVCGIELVPAAQFGFTSRPVVSNKALVVPRNAVLMAGDSSVIYVEVEPGRFEIRPVVLGPTNGDEIAILDGLDEGEQVACSGNFLIDSQMQLAGKPSLIDPTRAKPKSESDVSPSAEVIAALAKLSPDDRTLAESQRICPVTMALLGSMGTPIKVDLDGKPVFICCEGCRKSLLNETAKYLAILADQSSGKDVARTEASATGPPPIGAIQMFQPQAEVAETPPPVPGPDPAKSITDALAKLAPVDRATAERQKVCPVTNLPLGSMGIPIKVRVNGRSVFICCEGCRAQLLAEPVKYLANLPKEISR